MNARTKSMHTTPVGGNVSADLGLEREEATALQTESQHIFSDKPAIKDFLMAELVEWIKEKRLTQTEAAEILAVTYTRVSDLINRKAIEFTVDALVEMLLRAGKHVQFAVL